MVQGPDYYDTLGLTRGADDLSIRRAFRKLALKFHPEINKDPSASQEFNRMCEAYDVLSDRESAACVRSFRACFGHVFHSQILLRACLLVCCMHA